MQRLETPTLSGHRGGMTSSRVIGRRLESVYGLDTELPREMDEVLKALSVKLAGGRSSNGA